MTINSKQTSKLLGVSLLASLAPVASFAQDASEEEIFELSPFTVDASKDEGYRAGSTISGSRLNTELKDVAASVTVLTNAFMDDLGSTDLATALSMVAGTETDITTDDTSPSLSQGYLGGDFGDRNTRENSVRVRGLGRASTSANFIEVRGSVDRYNIERAEFLRGPNSILFGLAQPAGLMNYTTKRAHLGRDLNEVQFNLDNFGTARGVFDFSRVIKEDVLAIRAIFKNSKTQYRVKTAYQDDDRIFLTTTYKPFESTTITAFYEEQESDGRRPNYRLPTDYVSGWLDLWNQAHADGWSEEQIADNFYWDPYNTRVSNGEAPRSPDIELISRLTGEPFNPELRDDIDGRDKALTAYYDNTDWWNPMDGFYTRHGTVTASGSQPTNSSAVRARMEMHRSADPYEDDRGYADPQAIDEGIFPWKEYEISALPGNLRENTNEKVHFNLEQRITDNFYVSATYQKEDYSQEQIFGPIAQQNSIAIDINTTLPDGRVNKNFLRPMIVGRSFARNEYEDAESLLVQANYDLDFVDISDRLAWLGKHRITGFFSENTENTNSYRYGLLGEQTPGVLGRGGFDSSKHMYPTFYVGDPVQPGDTSLRLTGFPASTNPYRGKAAPYWYYDNIESSFGTWQFAPNDLRIVDYIQDNSPERTTIEAQGYGASLQSYLWQDRIVATLGWREDSVDTYGWLWDRDNGVTDGSQREHFEHPGDPTVSITEPTMTKGIVFHATNWLRVFANESENFDLTTPRTDNFFRPISPQSGKVEEYGLGLMLMENKLDLRFTAYETRQAGQSVPTSIARNRLPGFEDRLFDALSESGRIDEWQAVVGWDGDGPVLAGGSQTAQVGEDGGPVFDADGERQYDYFGEYDAPNDVAATQDSVSEGWETSVTFNPTKNWRFMASLSKLENAVANRQSEVLEYIRYRTPYWQQFFQEGLHRNGDTDATVYEDGDSIPSDDTLLSQIFLDSMGNELLEDLEAEGVSNVGISKYNARLTANYRFHDGRFKGVSLGTNLRWESGKVLGNELKQVDTTLGGVNTPTMIADPDNALRGDSHVTGGVMANYRKKIFNDRVDWRIQLNVNNLFRQGDDLRVIRLNPDGSAVFGINDPITYQLTNTFKF
ncbi:TonB-dependent receptor plug domain-containing protein [Pelagicoccus enzymogenes]|uniref:TonB-dependent receptor plug domain-containing protein n=1 Tax=Pelagicoccus enzymogenes TaxID=2773457 RepID=UPI0028100D6C|nr:TonB-dependent receptor plug domain-containing protein [Pelagicoccus enzymogenes]MDQ8200149.1 TonB-dependent receptor plug domain-containing protein [Pelagicoccus enzymogenes]